MVKKLIRNGIAIMLPSLLIACAGGPRVDPYVATTQRVAQKAQANNEAVADAYTNLKCPMGMRLVGGGAEIENKTNIRYTESHGDRRSGGDYGRNGRSRGSRSPYTTYSGARAQLRAETRTSGEGNVRCEFDLTPAR